MYVLQGLTVIAEKDQKTQVLALSPVQIVELLCIGFKAENKELYWKLRGLIPQCLQMA